MSCPACEPARLRGARFCPDCDRPVTAAPRETAITVNQNIGEARSAKVTGVAIEELQGHVTAEAYSLSIGSVHGGIVNVALAADRVLVEPRRSPIRLLPRPFSGLLDREAEMDTAVDTLQSAAPLVFYGESGLGKTSLLRTVAYHSCVSSFPDGVLCLPAHGRTRADLLQMLFDAFYECSIPYKPREAQIQHALQGKRALVVLDDLDLPRPDLEALMNLAPACTFLLASTDRSLWGEGKAIALPGLPQEAALALVERELGRPLDQAERRAFPELWRALDGHPQRLLEAAANAREERRSLALLLPLIQSPQLLEAQVLGSLTAPQQQVLAALAAPGGPSLSAEQLAALAQQPAIAPAVEALERRRLIESDGQRYSMNRALIAAAQQTWGRSEWMQRALAYFQEWVAQGPARQQLLAEADVLMQVLDWAVHSSRWPEVLELVRGFEGALALDLRWDAWRQALTWALEAARELNDDVARAWALHQLGTRGLCLEEFAEARPSLTQALELRERLGDQEGAQVTRHNLDLLKRLVDPSNDGCVSSLLKTMALFSLLTLSLVGLAGALLLGGTEDSLPPVLALPSDRTVEASTRDGAQVSFDVSARDSGSETQLAPSCDRRSGDTFPIGTTVVTCSVQDADGDSAEDSFSITVQDTAAPALRLPDSPLVSQATSPAGAYVDYQVSASDAVDGHVPVSCDPPPNVLFGPGETTVRCSAKDSSGNEIKDEFTVRVVAENPTNTPPVLRVPESMSAGAVDSSGAVVEFDVSATDNEDDPDPRPSCSPQSGQTFPIGTTRVTCSVRDSGGLVDEADFDVIVTDRTPPALSLPPSPLFWSTDSSKGAEVLYEVTSYDTVDGAVPAECDPPSGSFLPLGQTEVTCTAYDSHGNLSSDSFTVVVEYEPPLPDLIVVSIDAAERESARAVSIADFGCHVIYTVANDGQADASESFASIDYETTEASDGKIQETPALAAGERRQVATVLPARACNRPVTIVVTLDVREAIEELEETNNRNSRRFLE